MDHRPSTVFKQTGTMGFHWQIAIAYWFIGTSVLAQESRVYDTLSLQSAILNETKPFSIYLPPGYDASDERYPVVYLLHGGDGNHTNWATRGDMQATVDRGIREGKIKPMIIVMPDAGDSYYMNNIRGEYQYEEFFFRELMPFVEKHFRCRNEKAYRGISGLSMGGFGSLLYALHHPELFSSCAALSAGVRTDEDLMNLPYEGFLRRYKKALGDVKEARDRVTDFWHQNNIFHLFGHLPAEKKHGVRFYLDCGDDDFLSRNNSMLHVLMLDQKVDHEFRMRDGAHTWDYWSTGLPDALKFISDGMPK